VSHSAYIEYSMDAVSAATLSPVKRYHVGRAIVTSLAIINRGISKY